MSSDFDPGHYIAINHRDKAVVLGTVIFVVA
jgi:hypothetical protein